MSNLNEIKEENKELVQELMNLVFEKATQKSKKTNEYGVSKYLVQEFGSNMDISLDLMTFRRHHKGYISKKGKMHKPNLPTLNVFSKYVGYDDFRDFEINGKIELAKRKLKDEIGRLKKKSRIRELTAIALGALFFFTSIFFISKYYKKNCMIWVDDHYEKIRCSGLDNEVKFNLVMLENFKQVPLCDTTVIIRNDKMVLWYDKSDNKVTSFTHPGKHPTNGKTLKQMTPGIKKKYSVKCDSIKNMEPKGKS